ncbi:MAG: 3-hydroxybutyrate oligomer hydrolase family protein [Pseudomonadota bacterium]
MDQWHVIWESEPIFRAGEDDLLSAGLGIENLKNPERPLGATPRMAAVQKDIRDLINLSDPSLTRHDAFPHVEGWEHLALIRLQGLTQPITISVLIPSDFDTDRPTLVVAPSSGSRGVMGAIGDIGLWALPLGCAIALTDKGTGGAQLLAQDLCFGPDFEPVEHPDAPTNFRLKPTPALKRFIKSAPHSVALKHAYSGENVEAFWPQSVLATAEYASRLLLNRSHVSPVAFNPAKLKVIAAGVSNGGGAVLKGVERDKAGRLHAAVVVEPNITTYLRKPIKVFVGETRLDLPGRSLVDYATAMNMLVPAALLSPTLEKMPFAEMNLVNSKRLSEWSTQLTKSGLLEGKSARERATDALRKISATGFPKCGQPLLHAMSFMQIWPAVSHAFVCANGRYPVEADPIGASVRLATTDEYGHELQQLGPADPETLRFYGALSGGLSPGGGAVTLYKNGSPLPDLDDAVQLRRLAKKGGFAGRRLRSGARETFANAAAPGCPVMILHGRCDTLISVNHSSRTYVASLFASGADRQQVRYYEHEAGQHFESLLSIPLFSEKYDPLLPSFFQLLSAARHHLFADTALPPSQVIRRHPNRKQGTQSEPARWIKSDPGEDEIIHTRDALHIPA